MGSLWEGFGKGAAVMYSGAAISKWGSVFSAVLSDDVFKESYERFKNGIEQHPFFR
jgi:putative heme iron utilization protein